MNSQVQCQPTLRVNSASSSHEQTSVSVCPLAPDFVAFLARSTRPDDLLKSIFWVTVAQTVAPNENLPAMSGRYVLLDEEVQFVPHFPFERDVKYRAVFDPRPLGAPLTREPINLEFILPSEETSVPLTKVTHIFPSSDLLPENLLRFYVCFSNPMQRGAALKEISLLDSEGQPVADALYRPPLELWDRSMRRLTVLLDPGRLKRWVGPNVALGPPLKVGQEYTLEIGSGMIDQYGRPLRERFLKRFLASDARRERISLEHWKILPPETGSRQALMLKFANSLDWALLLHTITVSSADGSALAGEAMVDDCERRWSFTPTAPWMAGVYQIRVRCDLEDICGNNLAGAFDRPLQNGPNLRTERSVSSLTVQLI
jgi:hypothetical protein